jgi:hypothetical protein
LSSRLEGIVQMIGFRTGGVGLAMVLAPRWFRRVMADFLKLSDNEMRVIGYVLLGTAASIFAQQVAKQTLSAKLEAVTKQRPALA